MPSKKSHRKQLKNQEYNKTISSKARNAIKEAKKAITEDPSSEKTTISVKKAIQSLDKAAQKGVIHKNNAGRRKSRLVATLDRASNKK
ncbi:MAG: 30S ribosomal protein S20 [Chloroflexi bacterium]|nr:30S ribosomal protein S20 [Chloroflexota bacterium]|tara:strand:- start:335 stop:598 length:264 start_codon:yes stop_codon:yes gene_type:complete